MELDRTNPASARPKSAIEWASSELGNDLASLSPLLPWLLFMLLALLPLIGCGGDESFSDEASSSSTSTSSSTSSSASSSVSSLGTMVRPLSSTIISLDDGHQVGATHWPDGDTATGGLGQPIAGLNCGVTSNAYHVHAHLSIFLNGEALAVPADIGIVESSTSRCVYSTHTHNRTGIIHVEAPAAATFTLGQLFAIWGQPLGYTDVAGNPGLPVVVYLTDNNVVSEYTGDLAAIELLSHREITIQIGTAIDEIPSYTWTEP